ncbi:MAG: tryptophan synthase subunit alpha [Wenzhouxiangella sp.]|nr:tryptophan synthase subunit alpha [Wenzhouxiangella sp.]MDR9452314.1 tryptophan synthase subunit alpha [Wenzhouxiangella sp.]
MTQSRPNRIDRRFEALKKANRAALVPYITAGHPHPDATVSLLHTAVSAGADIVELGMPFSDVMADGPVIQRACERALEHGVGLQEVLAMVARFRQDDADTPVVLMGYTNPIERYGTERFAQDAAQAGVDGLLIVDCPADEARVLQGDLASAGLHQIFLVAPTTNDARLDRAAELAGGFVYYVSLTGVTGAATLNTDALGPMVERIRGRIDLPVAVGFGIREPEQAARVAQLADAVVIGSALVSKLHDIDGVDEACATANAYLSAVRVAMDEARESVDVAING